MSKGFGNSAYVLLLCILELRLKLGLGYRIWAWYVLAEHALLVLGYERNS